MSSQAYLSFAPSYLVLPHGCYIYNPNQGKESSSPRSYQLIRSNRGMVLQSQHLTSTHSSKPPQFHYSTCCSSQLNTLEKLSTLFKCDQSKLFPKCNKIHAFSLFIFKCDQSKLYPKCNKIQAFSLFILQKEDFFQKPSPSSFWEIKQGLINGKHQS